MAIISKKKIIFKVSKVLKTYLSSTNRGANLPLTYKDLLNYDDSSPLLEGLEEENLWETIRFPETDTGKIHQALVKIYALLKFNGDASIVNHFTIERIDHFLSGETKPFRIKIVNQLNKDFDYFYLKIADASRIYGLELEELLSPYRVNYLVDKDSIVEEHIGGIPGDIFIRENLDNFSLNAKRLAKEFIKFNERSFIRLLGDMHPGNFVVTVTQDVEDVHYRFRPIDFDHQSYEGKKGIYQPQNFKRNRSFLDLGVDQPTPELILQYQIEERSSIAKRINSSYNQIKKLTQVMVKDTISFPENVLSLKEQLYEHYKDKEFLICKNMGELVVISLKQLFKKKQLFNK
ncbi:hypothetical protein BH23BAC1_BH23BAC1_42550 [soil metagenome]